MGNRTSHRRKSSHNKVHSNDIFRISQIRLGTGRSSFPIPSTRAGFEAIIQEQKEKIQTAKAALQVAKVDLRNKVEEVARVELSMTIHLKQVELMGENYKKLNQVVVKLHSKLLGARSGLLKIETMYALTFPQPGPEQSAAAAAITQNLPLRCLMATTPSPRAERQPATPVPGTRSARSRVATAAPPRAEATAAVAPNALSYLVGADADAQRRASLARSPSPSTRSTGIQSFYTADPGCLSEQLLPSAMRE